MASILRAWIAGLAVMALPAMAGAAGITYDCDTAADHYSDLSLPAGAVPFSVSGSVQMNAMAGSKTFVPVARVQIGAPAAPSQAPSAFAGFSLGAIPTDPKKTPGGVSAVQMLGFSVNGKDDDILPLSMTTKPGTVQAFTLAYDGTAVTVTLGNETRHFPMKIAEPVVRIVCSTGEFLFTDLTITSSH